MGLMIEVSRKGEGAIDRMVPEAGDCANAIDDR